MYSFVQGIMQQNAIYRASKTKQYIKATEVMFHKEIRAIYE